MAVTFTHNTPILPVADVTATQAYYRDVLGFAVDWRERDLFGAVSCGDISLFFAKSEDPVHRVTCVLNTVDADAIYDIYVGRGAKIVEPIATQPWGMREFTVEDINGHLLRIGHVDESSANYGAFEHG